MCFFFSCNAKAEFFSSLYCSLQHCFKCFILVFSVGIFFSSYLRIMLIKVVFISKDLCTAVTKETENHCCYIIAI